MKRVFWMIVFTVAGMSMYAQTLSQCISKAIERSASPAQLPLIQNALSLQQDLARNNLLPKVALNGTATWQSDVTSLPIKLPNINVPTAPQDQYRVTLDVQQNVWDGGATTAQKKVNLAQSLVETSKIETELYAIKEQIVQLYFNAALLGEQMKNVQLLKEQLEAKLKKMVENQRLGTATSLHVRQLQARNLELDVQYNDLLYKKRSVLNALEAWTGNSFSIDFQPVISIEKSDSSAKTERPEIRMLNAQVGLAQAQQNMLHSKYAPKVALTGTLGYGRPGLNFLATDFDFYGIIGVNVRVPLEHFYTRADKQEKALWGVQQDRINKQIDGFNFQQNIKLQAQKAVIEQLKQAIVLDEKMLELRASIKQTVENQLDNGMITSSDFLEEVKNELLVRQNLSAHKIQLAHSLIQYDLILGSY